MRLPHVVLSMLALALPGCVRRAAGPHPPAGDRPGHGPVLLDAERASGLAALALGCIDREYPNKPSHVLDGDDTVLAPREVTPAFFGCFDWHSAVHGHWTLVRLLGRFPDLPEAARIRDLLDAHLDQELLTRELVFFQSERARLFERPYGWGWLLRLAAELHRLAHPHARRWEKAVQPLARYLAKRSVGYLGKLSVPVRAGTHDNTAFAMAHMLDYARTVRDSSLAQALVRRARELFGGDRACPVAYEPSGEDFISPCLAEADLMRRVLDPEAFVAWLDAFLPPVDAPAFAPLRRPVAVRDPRDPKIGHLIGLALQRAWCYEGIAGALPPGDPRRRVFVRLARRHRDRALSQMFESGYGGEHWLASFAVYLLTGAGRDAPAAEHIP